MAISNPLSRRKQSERTLVDATNGEKIPPEEDNAPVNLFRPRIFVIGAIVSLGGLIFGFDTGQISGFVEMQNFLDLFGDEPGPAFSNVREGTIVGLLSIGTLIGAICAGPLADILGRRFAIVVSDIVFIIGVIVQITTKTHWYQLAIGRLVAGLGVGALSVMTPMYQAETAPRQIRGAMVCTYQLFITLGIFLAYCINYGTYKIPDASSWRITMGVGFVFPTLMAIGIVFLHESPRWDYRKGNIDRARDSIAKSYGVSEHHWEVKREIREIKEKFEAETTAAWHEIFTAPKMTYRLLLGMTLQALQQLTGANFFFYYGTTVFKAVGLTNPFGTSMILGGINFGCTFIGLYVVENFGRRNSMITGALCMSVCFLIFASVGHFALEPKTKIPGGTDKPAGDTMIVFTCLFILSYATTWGPIVWALVAEIYPSKYRARAMGFATSSNWTFNFLLSFFTPFITADIDYAYGYVFAGCCFAGAVVVYFFVCESQGRSLEEIDTMYVSSVKPWKSKSWQPPQGIAQKGEEQEPGSERKEFAA